MRRSSFLCLVLALAVSAAHAELKDAPPAPEPSGADSQASVAAEAEPPAAAADALEAALALADKPPAPELAARPVIRHAFSDGPRAVPRARGASLARAEALGIGGHAVTRQLLWSRPSPELLAAVPGKTPKNLLWPVVGGTWGRGFGYTRKIRVELRHNGLDIGAPEGAPVRAAADGLVIYSDNTLNGLGNAVMILHPGGWTTLYGHTQRTTVQPGYYVKRGERIALVGHTGMAWGPHLHFEFRDNGRWRDPEPLMTGNRDLDLVGPLVDLVARDAAQRAEATPPAPQVPSTQTARSTRTRKNPH
jgi:murein DD-endopeptidase MepM/ murein hydrolase activator NlpD